MQLTRGLHLFSETQKGYLEAGGMNRHSLCVVFYDVVYSALVLGLLRLLIFKYASGQLNFLAPSVSLCASMWPLPLHATIASSTPTPDLGSEHPLQLGSKPGLLEDQTRKYFAKPASK